MTAFGVLLLIIVPAYLALRRFARDSFSSGEEALFASVPLGFAVFAALTSFFGIFLPTFISALLTLGLFLIFGSIALAGILRDKRKLFEFLALSPSLRAFFWIVFVLFSAVLIFLVLQSFIVRSDGAVSISRGASVDAPYHLAQIMRIGYTARLDFEEPNFAGEFIRYPFFINLVSGVLLKFGSSLGSAFHMPLIFLILSCVYFLITFFLFLKLGKFLTFFGVLGTLFGSSLGYIAYLRHIHEATLPIRNGVAYPMQNISYPGMIPGFLIVQRPFLLGFSLFLIGCILFFRAIHTKNPRPFFLAGIMLGLLPFSHSHSFIAFGIVVGSGILYLWFLKNDLFYDSVRYLIFPSFFIAIPQLASLILLPKFPAGSMVSLRLGWMSVPGQIGGVVTQAGGGRVLPWFRFFLTNFGFLLALPVWVVARMKKPGENRVLPFVLLSAILLWVLPNILQFQVWDFDTNKFFAYAILFSLAAVGVIIESKMGIHKKVAVVLFVLAVISSVPSAIIGTWKSAKTAEKGRVVMFTAYEQALSFWIRANTSENAVILSSAAIVDPETIQNPVVVAAGRKATAGFMTWLYTHGIDFAERTQSVASYFKEPGRAEEFLKDVPADYVIIDPYIRRKYPGFEDGILGDGDKPVFISGNLSLYRVSR